MCLQPCGSDMIRQSGSRQRGCDLGEFGGGQRAVGGRRVESENRSRLVNLFFLFIVKMRFPRRATLPTGLNHLVLQTGCHRSALPIYERCISLSSRRRPVICMSFKHAGNSPSFFPRPQRIVGFTSIKFFFFFFASSGC